MAHPLVLAEHVADLALADADVAGGDVGVLADMARELGHERLAEPHDLAVRAALRIEVGAALAAADRHAGQRVLERLLEAEELDDAEVHRRVEADAALVGSERRVELDAEAAVDPDLSLVVDPGHAEDDLPLGLADALDQRVVGVVGMLGDDAPEALEDLPDRLMELLLAGIAAHDLVEDRLELFVDADQFILRRQRWFGGTLPPDAYCAGPAEESWIPPFCCRCACRR